MAGFLDTLFGTPEQTQALGLLGASLMKGKGADGFLLANQYMAEAPDRQLKRQLTQAQLQETLAQAEERQLRKAQFEQQQRMMGMLFPGLSGSGSPAASGVAGAPGAPAASPATQGQGGIIGLSQQLGIPVEAIQADIAFNGGKKISELIAERSKPNWQNINGNLVNTNAPGFKGGFQPGMSVSSNGQVTAWQPDGQGGVTVGAPRGAFETFGRYQGIQEDARAGRDLVKIIDANGTERYVTRAQAVQATQPQQPQATPPVSSRGNPADADRYAILTQELQRAEASGNAVDAAAIRNEINRLPASARMAPSPSGLAVAGPMQSAPSPEQAAAAAAAREKAVMDAKAESERQAGRTKKADQANDMLSNIARARQLMTEGATGSLIGAGVDKVMGVGGFSTQSSTNADKLETIAGWLVANVPRMEGPQSNYDVQNYQVMAGRVGDRSYPIAGRLAALEEIERIQRKYARLNTGNATNTNQPNQQRQVVKTGKYGGRKVVQYSDGTVEYAD